MLLTMGQTNLVKVLALSRGGHRGAVGHPPRLTKGTGFSLHRDELQQWSIMTPYTMDVRAHKHLTRAVCRNGDVCTFITLGGRVRSGSAYTPRRSRSLRGRWRAATLCT